MNPDERTSADSRNPADAAVREMEEQLKPIDPVAPHAPPLREEYGGPRRASDGKQVSPDPSEPVRPPGASAKEGRPSVRERAGEEEDDDADKPPAVPPDEPPPVPVQDPPPQPSPPYVVAARRRSKPPTRPK